MKMDSLVDAIDEEDVADDDIESSATETAPVDDSFDAPDSSGESLGLSDDELDALLDEQTTEITVVGCGGAGCNTATRMVEKGIEGADIIAANTDVQHLVEHTNADSKLLLGRNETKGRGAGSVPQVGRKSALENEQEIRDAVENTDMVFVTAGMGGGTGTGAAPIVAELAHEAGALTIAVVTMPFDAEGRRRRDNADGGLAKLREAADTVIVVPNEKLLEDPKIRALPMGKAFEIADEVLYRSVKGITELINSSGMVNLDFADVTTVMENGDVALIGMGDSDTESRGEDSVKAAIRSPMLDVDITDANSVLVNVTGGPDMSIEEAEGVVEYISEQVGSEARIIWGASVNPEFGKKMETMLVVTGVKSDQIFGQTEPAPEDPDIDYIEG